MLSTAFIRQKIFHISLLSLGVMVFPLPASAVQIEEVLNPRQSQGVWVTDMAEVLSSSTEAELNEMIADLEAHNGSEIAVVTVPETAPSATPKVFATELFNHWGIGKTDQDNGVLFLISVSDRRVEIETGYGVEAILPDAKVGNIIDQQVVPSFKQGNFDAGTLAGTRSLVFALGGKVSFSNPDSRETVVSKPNKSGESRDWPAILGGVFVAAVIVSAILNNLSKAGDNRGRSNASNAHGGYYGGGGSSGSGGGGFGGGSSGGGGAGGGW